jgi:hypothetical protein
MEGAGGGPAGRHPQLYLTQLLINLPTLQIGDLSTWLPDQRKRTQAARTATM